MSSKRGSLQPNWERKGGHREKGGEAEPPKQERPPTSPVPTVDVSTEKRKRRPKGTGNEVGINLRMTPDAWTALGVLAAKQRRAKQELLLEALDLLLVHYGEEPVARPKQ